MTRLDRFPSLLSTLAFLLAGPTLADAPWPHARGPAADGQAAGVELPDGPLALELSWRVPLGSGYSGIVADAERIFTAFASGEDDVVAAFRPTDGREVWRAPLGPRTAGHSGSDDGPLSSPTLAGDRVVALASSGRLVALDAATGELRWERALGDEDGARRPYFGYTTTPIAVGDRVVVQAGGDGGRSILALDTESGEVAWSTGDDPVHYQSPHRLVLDGRPQIVAVSDTSIVGLEPADGAVLWTHPLPEGARSQSATAVPLDDSRFLAVFGPETKAFEREGDGLREVWTSQALGNTYALPVVHEGHVYGFRGQILTCLDAATGERVWRSRPPGGSGLILVDGRLVIFGAQGRVVVAEASPASYRPLAEAEALGGSSLTWPAFSGGRIVVRNLEEMAAVDLGAREGAVESDAAPRAGVFAAWLDRVRALEAPERAAAVDEILAKAPGGPLVDGPRVTFLYRGEADDVGVRGSFSDVLAWQPLERLEGTDLFHGTLELEPGIRWEYELEVDFDDRRPDPRNPHRVPAVEGDGEVSEIRPDGMGSLPLADDPAGAEPRLEELVVESTHLGEPRTVRVWLPAGEEPVPLVVVLDGKAWIEKGRLPRLLERKAPDVAVAFVESPAAWWRETGGNRTGEAVRMLVEEVIPAVAKLRTLSTGEGDHGLLARGYFGCAATLAALRHPEIFGRLALSSPASGLGPGDDLVESAIAAGKGTGVEIHLEWRRWDERDLDRGWDYGAHSRALFERLRESGHAVAGGQIEDSYGWGSDGRRMADLLRFLVEGVPSERAAAGR